MRADFAKFMRAYRRPKRPKEISQEAYEFKTKHLARLMSWNNELPDAEDLHDYAEDISYTKEVQPDLFTYLLPVYLQTWRHGLMRSPGDPNSYSASISVFTAALAKRRLLHRILKPKRAEAVMVFMRNSILDRIDQEAKLAVDHGNRNHAHDWLDHLGDFAVLFSDLASLWRIWWTFETPGQAIAALQYFSALMYEEDSNPIYAPWTPEHGGGPPSLWDTTCLVYDQSWLPENVAFLKETLTTANARVFLERAVATLNGITESPVPAKMMTDFEAQRPLLEHRIRALPEMLSQPFGDVFEWPPMPKVPPALDS